MPYPGVDIIEIERFAQACGRQPRLPERVFTARERAQLSDKGYQSWAACFAGKEAVLKTLGTGLSGLSWQDIEILSEPSGEPLVYLSPRAQDKAWARGASKVWVSLTHNRTQAVAFAILQ